MARLPITWQQLAPPDFSGASFSQRTAADALNRAVTSASAGLDRFKTARDETNDSAAFASALRFQDPATMRAALESGNFGAGVDPTRLTPRAFAALGERPRELLAQDTAGQTLATAVVQDPLRTTGLGLTNTRTGLLNTGTQLDNEFAARANPERLRGLGLDNEGKVITNENSRVGVEQSRLRLDSGRLGLGEHIQDRDEARTTTTLFGQIQNTGAANAAEARANAERLLASGNYSDVVKAQIRARVDAHPGWEGAYSARGNPEPTDGIALPPVGGAPVTRAPSGSTLTGRNGAPVVLPDNIYARGEQRLGSGSPVRQISDTNSLEASMARLAEYSRGLPVGTQYARAPETAPQIIPNPDFDLRRPESAANPRTIQNPWRNPGEAVRPLAAGNGGMPVAAIAGAVAPPAPVARGPAGSATPVTANVNGQDVALPAVRDDGSVLPPLASGGRATGQTFDPGATTTPNSTPAGERISGATLPGGIRSDGLPGAAVDGAAPAPRSATADNTQPADIFSHAARAIRSANEQIAQLTIDNPQLSFQSPNGTTTPVAPAGARPAGGARAGAALAAASRPDTTTQIEESQNSGASQDAVLTAAASSNAFQGSSRPTILARLQEIQRASTRDGRPTISLQTALEIANNNITDRNWLNPANWVRGSWMQPDMASAATAARGVANRDMSRASDVAARLRASTAALEAANKSAVDAAALLRAGMSRNSNVDPETLAGRQADYDTAMRRLHRLATATTPAP